VNTMQKTTQHIITLTPKAVEKAKKFTDGKGVLVKFGIRKGGCSGFMYDIGFVKEAGEGDKLVEQDGATVVVPKDSVEFLKGSTIDYHDALLGAGFRIDNPNVTRKCKCGHSVR
jgi:iron-sulfur cluster assembly accessory protein